MKVPGWRTPSTLVTPPAPRTGTPSCKWFGTLWNSLAIDPDLLFHDLPVFRDLVRTSAGLFLGVFALQYPLQNLMRIVLLAQTSRGLASPPFPQRAAAAPLLHLRASASMSVSPFRPEES